MKKSLLALAVLGAFAGAASAQSSVTLYGIVDMGVQRTDPANGDATTGIASGIQSGSRWGLRGSEDIGSGWSAIFTLESGFNGDTGTSAQGGRLFGRQAFAGLRNTSAGTFALGRFATFSSGTGSFDMFGKVDPFGAGFSVMGLTFSSMGGIRVDNAALWQSPDWGGFRAGLGYSFASNGSEVAGSSNNLRTFFSGLSYSYGPLYVAATYDVIKPADTGATAGFDDEKRLQIGATYDLKVVKLHAAYGKEDSQFASGLTAAPLVATADSDEWLVGFTVPLGNFAIIGSYSKRDGDAVTVGTTTTEFDRNVWALGATYSLSRRTNLYLSYADADGKKSLKNTANDTSIASLGIRHSF